MVVVQMIAFTDFWVLTEAFTAAKASATLQNLLRAWWGDREFNRCIPGLNSEAVAESKGLWEPQEEEASELQVFIRKQILVLE